MPNQVANSFTFPDHGSFWGFNGDTRNSPAQSLDGDRCARSREALQWMVVAMMEKLCITVQHASYTHIMCPTSSSSRGCISGTSCINLFGNSAKVVLRSFAIVAVG